MKIEHSVLTGIRKSKKSIRKILIFRTAPFSLFESCLDLVRETLPESEIYVAIQSSFKEKLNNNSNIKQTIIIRDGFFNIFTQGYGLYKKLKKEKFDAYVLLTMNRSGENYFHFVNFIRFLKCEHKYFYNISSELRELSEIYGKNNPILQLSKPILGHIIFYIIKMANRISFSNFRSHG